MPIWTFWQYICLWLKAALAPAWHLLGVLSLALGAIFWIWLKIWPASFTRAAAYLRLTPEAAMSDLVWGVPLGIGFLVLSYRLVRAPFEIQLQTTRTYTAEITKHDAELEQLRSDLRKCEANVLVARELQRTLNRIAQGIVDGTAHLSLVERGEPLSLIAPHARRWERDIGQFLREQVGPDAWLRFGNANNPVIGNSVTWMEPNDHASLARRIRGQLDFLDALSRRLQDDL